MSEPGHYDRFVRYNTWANRRTAEMLAALPTDRLARPLLLFSHLLRAERVWLARIQGSRIQGLSAAPELWETDSLTVCRERLEVNAAAFELLLTGLEPATLTQPTHYANSQGTQYSTPLSGILDHVFNHSTHHRGQVALLVRDAGGVPQPLDLIIYLRLG